MLTTLFALAALAPAPLDVPKLSPDRLRAHLEFIASDLLEGRQTPSRGLDIAGLYVATQLKLFGVAPGGEKATYFQPVVLRTDRLDPKASRFVVNGSPLEYGEAYFSRTIAGGGTGGVVYVGHGYRAPSRGLDPYRGLDVKGKYLLTLVDRPPTLPAGDRIADEQTPEEAARALGALGVLQIPPPRFLGNWTQRVRSSVDPLEPTLELPSVRQIPSIVLSKSGLEAITKGEAVGAGALMLRSSREPGDSFELKTSLDLDIKVIEERQSSENVIGIVPGSDPKLRDEYVVIGAHLDHIGVGQGTGDQIYNGADDDGSGTVSLLEMARALSLGAKPKRSTLFIWHVGEEEGLWGSQTFAARPTVPANSIVAMLNIDMIGRSKAPGDKTLANQDLTDANSVYVIGPRVFSPDLGAIIDEANRGLHGLRLDRKYDDLKDPQELFNRSDHYSYVEKGIPAVFFISGLHSDYHEPSDEVDKIDFTKMARIARTVLGAAILTANRPDRPRLQRLGS